MPVIPPLRMEVERPGVHGRPGWQAENINSRERKIDRAVSGCLVVSRWINRLNRRAKGNASVVRAGLEPTHLKDRSKSLESLELKGQLSS